MLSRDAEQELAELALDAERFFAFGTALQLRTVGQLAGARLSANSVSGVKEFERGRILTLLLGSKNGRQILLLPIPASWLPRARYVVPWSLQSGYSVVELPLEKVIYYVLSGQQLRFYAGDLGQGRYGPNRRPHQLYSPPLLC